MARRTPPTDNALLTVWSCDHCGTVERALTLWGEADIRDCRCACHVRHREHDAEVYRLRRRRGEML